MSEKKKDGQAGPEEVSKTAGPETEESSKTAGTEAAAETEETSKTAGTSNEAGAENGAEPKNGTEKESPKEPKKKKKDKLSFRRTVENNVFAMKLAARYSRAMVIAGLLYAIFGYFEWVFFDGIFMRRIIESLDNDAPFRNVMTFILMTGAIFFVLNLYEKYVDNVTFPLGAVKLYGGIYKELFTKAKNVELRCYEDSDFYDKYTMAMDGAEEKIFTIVKSFWEFLVSIPALIVVFYFMFEIDHYAVLFIIS